MIAAPYRTPDALIDELGITQPGEIDIEAIAYHCGAIVKYRRLDGCAARIVGHGDKAIITIDPNSKPGRVRFSAGHELGHWMRDRGKAAHLCQKSDLRKWTFRQDPESLANHYAASLLMPTGMFRESARDRPMTFASVNALAGEYKTSKTATAIRLVELGSFPAMLICYTMKGRSWFHPGPDVPREFWPAKELPHQTEAFELLFGSGSETKPILADAGDWIDHRNSSQYSIHEHAIKIADDAILVMLWWKDEAQLVDLD